MGRFHVGCSCAHKGHTLLTRCQSRTLSDAKSRARVACRFGWRINTQIHSGESHTRQSQGTWGTLTCQRLIRSDSGEEAFCAWVAARCGHEQYLNDGHRASWRRHRTMLPPARASRTGKSEMGVRDALQRAQRGSLREQGRHQTQDFFVLRISFVREGIKKTWPSGSSPGPSGVHSRTQLADSVPVRAASSSPPPA